MGKFLAGLIIVSALIAGTLLYYLQVHVYYQEITAPVGDEVSVTTLVSETPEPIIVDDFQGIASETSPLGYRACFTTPQSQAMMTETYVTYENAAPHVAPEWFDCFDAKALGAAIEANEAIAFMGEENVVWGFDRIVAVMDDGRGFVWHQMNICGEEVFHNGKPMPEHCPPRDTNTNTESN
ncbi:DUF6446 family protein [Halocynthiibacter namhaensis]|uniref:DUF6446 family protein n=1 Tax=Halocynthiibacter namhaensis TaxID=1290553 RepID=UPI0005799224|nr:DUF6446 family protein [Halocynthiibacter namhaensis]